jgi:hypothetical protein
MLQDNSVSALLGRSTFKRPEYIILNLLLDEDSPSGARNSSEHPSLYLLPGN